ncbi:MAG: hypothetical protein SNJ71_01530 [Bacteroidales bacterium]
MKQSFLFFIFTIAGIVLYSQNYTTYTGAMGSGTWQTASIWNGSVPGYPANLTVNNTNATISSGALVTHSGNFNISGTNTNLTIHSTASLTINGNLILDREAQITVNGTLIINGNVEAGNTNNVKLTINGGGKVQVNGNFTAKNNLDIMNNGELKIAGTLAAENSAEVRINGSAEVTAYAISVGGGNSLIYVDGVLRVDTYIVGGGVNSSSLSGNGYVWALGANDIKVNAPPLHFNSTLPISLLYFKASQADNSILLEWASATEHNNDFYSIEKSTDGVIFTEIGKLKGIESSKIATYYSTQDNNIEPNTMYYYRLYQTDLDGTKTQAGETISAKTNETNTIKFVSVCNNGLIKMISETFIHSIELFNIQGTQIFRYQTGGDINNINISIPSNEKFVLLRVNNQVEAELVQCIR